MTRFFTGALCALCLLFSSGLYAQSSYYWSDNHKINLQADPSSLIIQFNEGYQPANFISPQHPKISNLEIHAIQGRAVVQLNSPYSGDVADLAAELVGNPAAIRSATHGWKLDDGFPIWATHRIVLELKDQTTLADLQSYLDRYEASFTEMSFNRTFLEVAQVEDALPLANAIRESGMVNWCHPDFYAKIKHFGTPTDPLYGSQFQMHNTGQNGGTADIDADAPEAWAITKGSAGIRVAVIDDGVDAHEDLPNLNLSLGYTPVSASGAGLPNASGAHGVACAGIIGAAHNNLGVAGMAPNVELFSVNIFEGGETGSDLANAITYSKNQGADILSNSWGYGSCTFSLSVLNSALADARNNGRGGKGCVIVFASGNDFQNCVSYPGNNSNVIGVGAIANTGSISNYSNEGPALDISAPSNGGTLGVYTTDREGSAGYASGNYTTTFGGTSAACPLVAGVAALVLSVDGNLSSTQVQNILETTATDMGSAGFDNTFGHGRVDADDAVIAAGGSTGGGGGGGSTCADTEVTLTLITDSYGSETSWSLRDAGGNLIASGSGYANNTTYTEVFCLPDGCYDFTIDDSFGDGICCAYGNGSYDLSDASGSLASGGSFTTTETTNFCVGSTGGGGSGGGTCPTIDFSTTTINSYGGSQDNGTSTVTADGWLVISNNAWKSINYNYTVTPNTVIEFDFGSTDQGEIQGIGFDSDNGISSNRTFRLYGTQNWGIGNYDDYAASAGSWKSYTIPVGQFYTGSFDRLIFACDDDAGNAGNAYFRNVKVYEGSCGAPALANFTNIGEIYIGNEGEDAAEVAMRLFPNPANAQINVELRSNSEIRMVDMMGRVLLERQLPAGTTSLSVDELPAGMYQISAIQENGTVITQQFVKR